MRSPLLLAILSAMGCGSIEETTMCLDVADDAATCPAAEDVNVDDLFSTGDCDLVAREVTGAGTLSEVGWDTGGDLACCYPVKAKDTTPFSECMIGRPYVEGDAATVAPVVDSGPLAGADAVHPALAAAWLRAARMEHASIAAFARLTLDLMALGAPAALLAEVQRAALDEVAHAEACFEVASRFAGRRLSPGPMPFAAPVTPRANLAAVAADAVREGCMGETIGAFQATAMAERAQDPAIRALLARIADDETRHAALSWKIVRWALSVGGDAVRAAVIAAFGQPVAAAPALDQDDPALEALGALGPTAHDALCREAVDAVIRPAAQALLAA
ncbi:MAG: ferritin-like domain-containing protein [Alphaproteobacteria bacterium]|nr:ferritin-like domain-containing protein [Alphaproteobacteria bacterium]